MLVCTIRRLNAESASHTRGTCCFRTWRGLLRRVPESYKPPSATVIRNRLPQDRYNYAWKKMKEEINRATEEDATLMFDGYTDDAERQLYNAFVSCERGWKNSLQGMLPSM